jgi:uncharacterized protein (TIGR03435 family)
MRQVILTILLLGSLNLAATAPQPGERRFDVASVKLSPPLNERIAQARRAGGPPPTVYDMRTQPGGRFTATMASLKMLVGYAFEVRDYQIEGGPAWLATDYFDIAATANADVAPAEIRTMLRALLTERFGLRARLETRQAPVHVLTVARSDGRLGPDLKRTSPECERQLEDRKNGLVKPVPVPSALPTTVLCGGMMMRGTPTGGSSMSASGTDIAQLINLISSAVAAPVSDRTGLSGHFDFTLEYTPERQVAGRQPGLDPNSDRPPPPISMALQQQLGLKLEQQLGPLPVVVIDAADHPTPD